MKNTITREYLANRIKQELGLSRADSLKLVSLILNNISNSIKIDKLVKLSNLGTFKIRNKNSRIGRNPKTGKESIITARSVVSFNASEKLKSRMNLK